MFDAVRGLLGPQVEVGVRAMFLVALYDGQVKWLIPEIARLREEVTNFQAQVAAGGTSAAVWAAKKRLNRARSDFTFWEDQYREVLGKRKSVRVLALPLANSCGR